MWEKVRGRIGNEEKKIYLRENEMVSLSQETPSSLHLLIYTGITISASIVCERGSREYDHGK